jgi:hypothetical protein
MQLQLFKTYREFTEAVDDLGFMPLSSNAISFPSLEGMTTKEMWHTGQDTDPWRWKTRIVEEKRAAYAKLFGGKPGFISLPWYPVFLAARRGGEDFESMYRQGLLSHEASRIYALFDENPVLATHEIKGMAGMGREAKSDYEHAMVELQMGMFITITGMTQMVSKTGEPHSWPATSYTTVENSATQEMIRESLRVDPDEALENIVERVLDILPNADLKKVQKFASGR